MAGRKGKMERWREISEDPKQPRELRDYLKKQFEHVKSGKTFNNPDGYVLQHRRGLEACKGFSYLFSEPNLKSNHDLQHRHDNHGKLLKHCVPAPIKDYMKRNPGDLADMKYQREVRNYYKNWMSNNGRSVDNRSPPDKGPGGGGGAGSAKESSSCSSGERRYTNTSQYRQERENIAKQYQKCHDIKHNRYESAPKAGGIELTSSIPLKSTYKVKSVYVDANAREVIVKTKGNIFWSNPTYKFAVGTLEPDELLALETAVKRTKRQGLMISFQMADGWYKRILDGVTTKGADKVIETLEQADFLLGSLVFGINYLNGTKTTSPVESYSNPLDERFELLEKCIDMCGKKCDQPSSTCLDSFVKYACVFPHPTFQINRNETWVESDGKGNLIFKGSNLLKINLRGIYLDWIDTVYYDDSAQHCFAQKSFMSDFETNYRSYMDHYPVFARLEQYASVISLLLLFPQDNVQQQLEVYVEQIFNGGTSLTDGKSAEVTESNREWTAAQQLYMIGHDEDPMVTLNQLLYVSNKWFNLDCFQESFEAAALVLHYGTQILDKKQEFPNQCTVKVYIAKALLQLARIIDAFSLQPEDLEFAENFLLGDSELQSLKVESKDYLNRVIINRAVDMAMEMAIKVEDWLTACSIVEFSISVLKRTGAEIDNENLDKMKEQLRLLKKGKEDPFAEAVFSKLSVVWLESPNGIITSMKQLIGPDFWKMLDNMLEGIPADMLHQMAGYVFFTDSFLTDDKHEALTNALQSRRSFFNFPSLELVSSQRVLVILNQLYDEQESAEICNRFTISQTKINHLMSIGWNENDMKSAIDEHLRWAHLAREKWMGRNPLDVVTVDKSIINLYEYIKNDEKVKQWQRVLAIDTKKSQIA